MTNLIADIVREEIQNIEINEINDSNILIIEKIKKKIEVLPWIDSVVVSRSLPSSLNIIVVEYQPFAIWQDSDNKYVINKDGKIIEIDNIEKFYNLLILTGKDANYNAKSLFNILTIDSNISKNIHYAAWIGNRRWNITFADGLLVKLPADNIQSAWDKLIKLYNMPGSLIDLKVIDLRNSKKIYLEYSNKTIKEFSN